MKRLLLMAMLVLSAFACQPEPTALVDDVGASIVLDEVSPDQIMSQIALDFATAMSDADVRLDVRDAMRRSPWGQHVLDLGQFLESPRGARASSRMSEVRSESVGGLHRLVRSLPPTDLYVPSEVMRRTWSGGADIGVYASLDFEGGAVSGYGTDGSAIRYQPGAHEANFLIGPRQRRIERYDIDPGDSTFIAGPSLPR